MAALAARKFSLFTQDDQQDSFSLFILSHFVRFLRTLRPTSCHTTSWRHHPVKPGQGGSESPTPKELRLQLHVIPGNSTVHPRATFGPTEPHDDQPKPNEE
ncbi:hypothetical protein MTP99_019703 [Tenebrio molitor]|nr:hypothetical protein MTP99_019703 [Tenebrio molitor]